MSAARGGFTLIETLIALVLSSLVIILVSSTFLVQNRYQANQVLQAGVHDNARAATDLLARELRSSMRAGILVAGPRTLTVRSPVAVATVCGQSGAFFTNIDVHIDGGVSRMATEEIAGVAVLDESTGAWDYERATWSFVDGGSTGSAARCAGNGADTLNAYGSFHSIRRLIFLFGLDIPDVGELVMLFRETTFRIDDSDLEPGVLALFREPYGRDPVEFASGIDTTASFRYRLGGTTYQDTVDAGSVGAIDAVRLVLDARMRSQSLPGAEVTFGLSTNLPLVNAP